MGARAVWLFLVLGVCISTEWAQQSQEKSPSPSVRSQVVPYSPSGTVKQYFVGTWRLVSAEIAYPDGKTEPYPSVGPDGVGYLMYDETGHMCVQLMRRDRPEWVDEVNPTAQEALSAILGFSAYCGTYEINEHEHVVIHRAETAWRPNRIGSLQQRPYQLASRDRFSFVAPGVKTLPTGEKVPTIYTITWERVK